MIKVFNNNLRIKIYLKKSQYTQMNSKIKLKIKMTKNIFGEK
jgi:hypothetical protein